MGLSRKQAANSVDTAYRLPAAALPATGRRPRKAAMLAEMATAVYEKSISCGVSLSLVRANGRARIRIIFDPSAILSRKNRKSERPVMKQRFSLSRHFMTFCLLLLWALFGNGCSEARAENELRVAVLQNYPPFSYTDEEGNPVGFDVEFAAALCRQLRTQCRTIALPLSAIIAGMSAQSLDMAVAGLGMTEERSRIMLFSDSYYRSHSLYIGRPDISLDDKGVEGRVLAAQHNSMQLHALRRIWQGKAVVVSYESHKGLLDALIRGRVDVVLIDGFPGMNFLKSPEGADFAMLGNPILPRRNPSGSCVTISKRHPGLVPRVNQAILTLRVTGEYERIMRKYFPFSIY